MPRLARVAASFFYPYEFCIFFQNDTIFSCHGTVVFDRLAAIVVVLLALIVITIYQRWRIGDQNVFVKHMIINPNGTH